MVYYFHLLCLLSLKVYKVYSHFTHRLCRNPIGNIDSAFREIPFDFDARLTEQYDSEENSVWDIVQILVKNHIHTCENDQMDQNFVCCFFVIQIQDAMLYASDPILSDCKSCHDESVVATRVQLEQYVRATS